MFEAENLRVMDSLDDSVMVVVYDVKGNETKKVSLSQFVDEISERVKLTANAQYASPLTNSTVAILDKRSWLILTHQSTIALLTIKLPSVSTIGDGFKISITAVSAITAVSWVCDNATVASIPITALSAGGSVSIQYSTILNSWFVV